MVHTIIENHGIVNFDSRPGKVMEIRKIRLGHGKVVEFQIFANIDFS